MIHPILSKNRRLSRFAMLGAALAVMNWLGLSEIVIAAAKVTDEKVAETPKNTSQVVYVTDFEIDSSNVKTDPGVLQQVQSERPRLRSGGLLQQARQEKNDPAAKAQELVQMMTDALIQDLKYAGFDARRLAVGSPLPNNGWLLRGIFTQVNSGNRMQRAVVGMGEGETQLEVHATVDDLTQRKLTPYYEMDTDATSGKKPGGAVAIVKKNPYAIAAKFVMGGRDLEKNVKQTAARIADDVESHIRH